MTGILGGEILNASIRDIRVIRGQEFLSKEQDYDYD
jgi:hypothetical protein